MSKMIKTLSLLCLMALGVFMTSCTGTDTPAESNDHTVTTSTAEMSSTSTTEPSEEISEIVIEGSSFNGLTNTSLNERYFSAIRDAIAKRDNIIAMINGSPLSEYQVLITKARLLLGYQDESPFSDDEIFNQVIKNELFYLAAQEQGLEYDEEYALSLSLSNIEIMKSEPTFFKPYLDAYGYSEKEYLENVQLPMHRNSQLYYLFVEKLLSEAGVERDTEEAEKIIKDKVDELYAKYSVEIR